MTIGATLFIHFLLRLRYSGFNIEIDGPARLDVVHHVSGIYTTIVNDLYLTIHCMYIYNPSWRTQDISKMTDGTPPCWSITAGRLNEIPGTIKKSGIFCDVIDFAKFVLTALKAQYGKQIWRYMIKYNFSYHILYWRHDPNIGCDVDNDVLLY